MKFTKNTIVLTCCTLTGIAFADLDKDPWEKSNKADVFQTAKNTNQAAVITELKSLFLAETPEKNALWQMLQEAKEGNSLIVRANSVRSVDSSNNESNLKRVFGRLVRSKVRSVIKEQGQNLPEEQKADLEDKLINDILQAIDSFIAENGGYYASISWSIIKQVLVVIANILNTFFDS